MSIRRYETTFTVPAGTAIAAPFTQAVPLEDNKLDSVRIVVPDGHAALTGLRILWSGTQKFPYNTGAWFIANGETLEIPYDEEVTEAGLSLAGYNLDVYQHVFYLRWQISDLITSPVADISSAQAGGAAGAVGTPDITQLSGGDTSGQCFDANGNVVDCSDPSAVSGPVTSPVPPAGAPSGGAGAGLPPPGGPPAGGLPLQGTPVTAPGRPGGSPPPHRQPPGHHAPVPPIGRVEPPGGHSAPPTHHRRLPPAGEPRRRPGGDGRPITVRPLPPPVDRAREGG